MGIVVYCCDKVKSIDVFILWAKIFYNCNDFSLGACRRYKIIMPPTMISSGTIVKSALIANCLANYSNVH